MELINEFQTKVLSHQDNPKLKLKSRNINNLKEEIGSSYNDQELLSHALILIQNSEMNLAENILLFLLDKSDQNEEAYKWLGFCSQKQGRSLEAISCFESACKINRTEDNLYFLAEIYFSIQKDDEAKQIYNELLLLIDYQSPRLFGIYKNLGNICLREQNLQLAEENFYRAQALCPLSDILLVNFGVLELQKNNVDEAIKKFREAIQINYKSENAWIGLAMIYRERSDFDLAWGNLDTALDINFQNATGLKLSVKWGLEDSKLENPINRLLFYLEINDRDFEYIYILSSLLYKIGHYKDSIKYIKQCLHYNPNKKDYIELEHLIKLKMEQSHAQLDK